MPDFEDLRMADLIKKFKAKIEEVANSGKLSKLKDASPKLQDIYNFHLTAHSSFAKQEEYLKNMYSSFNYAALIANDAAKTGNLSSEDKVTLTEKYRLVSAGTMTEELRAIAIGLKQNAFGYTFICDRPVEGEGISSKIPTVEELFVYLSAGNMNGDMRQ